MDLRPYQREAVASLFDYFARRDGDPLVVLPTGSGKSVVQADFVAEAIGMFPSTRVLCLTHVKELIDQNALRLRMHAPKLRPLIGVNSAGLNSRDTRAQVLFAGIQSVYKRARTIGHVDLIIVDEAHLIPHKGEGMYRKFIDAVRDVNDAAKLIGFTATPYRLNSGLLTHGEGKLFSSVCYDADLVKLIDDGYLAPLVSVAGETHYDTSAVRTRGGEFVASDLAAVLSDDVTRKAITEIVAEGQTRKAWLLFCGSVEQARSVTSMLAADGVPAALITGETDAAQRDNVIASFKAGKLRALVNVNVLTTGFDYPGLDMIALLRPTKSPGLYVQMLGRGMRVADGKSDCLVLDFGENIARHGPINMVKVPRAPAGDGDAVLKSCPECLFEGVPAGMMICPECGYEFPQQEIKVSKRSRADVIQRRPRKWIEITRVDYRRHRKEGKPDSLRVDYWGGMNRVASEWVCVEHEGYAKEKALGWLMRRIEHDDFPPVDVGAAIAYGEGGRLRTPTSILIDETGQYLEIASYAFEGTP